MRAITRIAASLKLYGPALCHLFRGSPGVRFAQRPHNRSLNSPSESVERVLALEVRPPFDDPDLLEVTAVAAEHECGFTSVPTITGFAGTSERRQAVLGSADEICTPLTTGLVLFQGLH